MQSYDFLLKKLESFIRRYYVNELIKGAILFVSIGLLYFLLTLVVEYFLWLNSLGRSLLFWAFIAVEGLLLVRFVVLPLLKLFRLSKGLDNTAASKIIGHHFPQVKDKLLNLLQLRDTNEQSELLLASIDQKARELQPVPFASAIDFRVNFQYLKFAVLPVLILGAIFLSGNSDLFADSYTRVVNYQTAYEPPAPFTFQVTSSGLQVEEGGNYTLQVQAIGDVIPETASVSLEGQTYFLRTTAPGIFEYTFESVKAPIDFFLTANKIRSRSYRLEVLKVPRLLNFEMILDYPSYTGKREERLNGSGNATVPEGTKVEWQLKTVATDQVNFISRDSVESFERENNSFRLQKTIFRNENYRVTTSNEAVKDYEPLEYSLEVIKDEYPVLDLDAKRDTVDLQTWYFHGKASDDYGLRQLNLMFYQLEDPERVLSREIGISQGNFSEFLSTFPDTLALEEGKEYEFYFQLTDNDGLRNGKSVTSEVFSYRRNTAEEKAEQMLQQQKEAIKGLDSSLEDLELSEKELEELSRLQKEKGQLNYNEKKKLDAFLNRQQQQMELMQNFNRKLQESLQEEENQQGDNEFKELLEERLDRRENRLEENEKLLKELQEYSDKIEQEELLEKLEDLSKTNTNQERNLEQLLELTKRYYVEQKAAKLTRDIEKLSKEQEIQSTTGERNTSEMQDSLSGDFDKLKEELEELQEENQALKDSKELGIDEALKEEIKEEQKQAGEKLDEGDTKAAEKHQKKAAEKMEQLAEKMKQQRAMAAGQQMQEDVDMLRQILDNLLVFSFEQEDLLEDFGEMQRSSPMFAAKLRHQNVLKAHFSHVDDSLFALALRNPMMTEGITDRLTDISFDLDKALDRLADNELPQGMASQQYVITGANELALFLTDILQNMQDMMQPSGSGSGQGDMQLPDLIQKQGELREQMQEGIQEQEKGEGKSSGEGESGKLFEIFKEQQQLREALKKLMEEEGKVGSGEELNEEMKKLEEEILQNGFNPETLERMQKLEHRMLEMEDAERRDGKKEVRESTTNQKEFGNRSKDQILKAKEYFNTTEILNRQSLPLRQIYQEKVRDYFERGDH